MVQYLFQRLLLFVPVTFGVLVMTFIISHVIPADPAAAYAGIGATKEQIQTIRQEFGLDKPLHVQFVCYIRAVLHGDLGKSIRTRRPVLEDIKQYAPATIELSLFALLLSCIFGIFLGVLSAVNRNKPIDHILRLFALIGRAAPSFWIGLLSQVLLFRILHWLPCGGRISDSIAPPSSITGLYTLDSLVTGNWQALGSSVIHIILPAVILAISRIGYLVRMQRATLLEVLSKQYLMSARAKGLHERTVIWKHAFRNALIPIITILALAIGGMLGGSFVVEIVFAWPGIGRYGTEAIIALDFNAIMGVSLILAIVYSLANLLADVLYALIDPRIKYAT